MSIVSRRTVAKVGLSLVAFVPAARALAAGGGSPSSAGRMPIRSTANLPPPPPPGTSLVIDKFVSGNVVALSLPQIRIRTEAPGDVLLYLSATTDVWEGRFVRTIPIEIGDRLTVWGTPRNGAKAFDVEKLWINIVNLIGPISRIQPEGQGLRFSQRDRHMGATAVRIDPRTLIAGSAGLREPYSSRPIALREAQVIQVIGRRLKDGSVLATDVLT